MSWNTTPVQFKTASGNSNAPAATMDANPQIGNTLVVGVTTSNEISPANDGWALDATYGFRADFVWLGQYRHTVTAIDNPASFKSWARSSPVSDRWGVIIAEFEGTGPWDTDTVQDKAIANKPSQNGATTISTGTTAGLDQPDGLAVAVVAFSRTISGGTATVTGWSNGFTQVAAVGASGGDAPYIAMAVKDVGNSVAGVETTATLSTGENRPIGLMQVMKTDPPVTIRAYRSASDYGGAETDDTAEDLLPDLSRLTADAGGTTYWCVYMRVDEPNLRDLSSNTVVSVSQQFQAGLEVQIGAASQAAGVTVPAQPNATAAPAGVSFDDTADLGLIGPAESRGLWIRYEWDAEAADRDEEPWEFDIDAEPL